MSFILPALLPPKVRYLWHKAKDSEKLLHDFLASENICGFQALSFENVSPRDEIFKSLQLWTVFYRENPISLELCIENANNILAM